MRCGWKADWGIPGHLWDKGWWRTWSPSLRNCNSFSWPHPVPPRFLHLPVLIGMQWPKMILSQRDLLSTCLQASLKIPEEKMNSPILLSLACFHVGHVQPSVGVVTIALTWPLELTPQKEARSGDNSLKMCLKKDLSSSRCGQRAGVCHSLWRWVIFKDTRSEVKGQLCLVVWGLEVACPGI